MPCAMSLGLGQHQEEAANSQHSRQVRFMLTSKRIRSAPWRDLRCLQPLRLIFLNIGILWHKLINMYKVFSGCIKPYNIVIRQKNYHGSLPCSPDTIFDNLCISMTREPPSSSSPPPAAQEGQTQHPPGIKWWCSWGMPN